MAHPLLVLLELLATATCVALFARRFRIPYSTALVVTGLVVSYTKLLPNIALDASIAINVFLPVLLFESAINTDASHLRENFRPVALLATLGMGVMAAVTGLLLHVWLQLDWPVALLLGTMLSITDTVAVLAIFKDLKVPRRLATILEGESIFNDGTALVLFRLLLGVTLSGDFRPARAAIDFVLVFLGGAIVGGVVGLSASWVLKQTRDHLTEIMLTTLVALGAYFAGEQLHVSGVIAVVVAGLVVGNYGWRRSLQASSQVALGSFWEYAGFGVNSALFLLVGLNLNFGHWPQELPAIALAFTAVLIGRVCVVYPAFAVMNRLEGGRDPVPLRYQHVMVWANLKGSLTMALAISLPLALAPRTQVIAVAFGVVLLSLVLQGLTLGPLVRALGLAGSSSLRQIFEREQLRLIAARAAQAELRTLHDAGILSKGNYERLRSRYQVSIAASERELRRLSTEFQGHGDEVMAEIRHRLLLVEKGAALDAMRQQLISEEVVRAYVDELDRQLVTPPAAVESEPPAPGQAAGPRDAHPPGVAPRVPRGPGAN